MELRREHAALAEEQDGIQALLSSDKAQWKLVGVGLRGVRKLLGPETTIGKRRSTFAAAPVLDAAAARESFVTREVITVILSERGWIRAARGRVEDTSALTFKEGDRLAFAVSAETTDKLLIFATDGRLFTLACDKLPSARGHGEPLRLMVDLDDKAEILAVFTQQSGRRRVLASRAGYGFILPEDEAISLRKAGKQALNVGAAGAAICLEANGDHIAVIGDNGKILIFPLGDLPEMPRGKGLKLQSYRQGALRDAAVFFAADGASWTDTAGRARAWPEWREWLGGRAGTGRAAPKGFPASRRFRPK